MSCGFAVKDPAFCSGPTQCYNNRALALRYLCKAWAEFKTQPQVTASHSLAIVRLSFAPIIAPRKDVPLIDTYVFVAGCCSWKGHS